MEQIQFETNGLTVLAVKVPSMSFGYDIQNYTTEVELIYMLDLSEIDPGNPELESDETLITVKLPEPGKWKVHAVTPLTEEQSKVLVEIDESISRWEDYDDVFYINYDKTEDNWGSLFYRDPIGSSQSLLRSHGIDPAEKQVILIKQD